MQRRSRIRLFAACLLILIGPAGCMRPIVVGPPAHAELEQIRTGKLAVVLFQLQASIDGKPLAPPVPDDGNLLFRLHLANLDRLAAPERIVPLAASESVAGEGWRHLLLPPGTYFLLVLPPGLEQNPPAVAFHAPSARFGRLTRYSMTPGRGGFWSPEMAAFVFAWAPPADFREIPGFWFHVPHEQPAVYLGSISTSCIGGRGLFGDLIDSCSELALTHDLAGARETLAQVLPEATPPISVPLVPNGQAREKLRPGALGVTKFTLRGPVELRAAYTGSELAPWGTFHGVGPSAGVLNLLAILAEGATRAGAEQHASERDAQTRSCMQALSATLADIDYASQLVPALEHSGLITMHRSDTNAGSPQAGHRLVIDVPIVQLRETGSPDHLALELGLSVRLESADGEQVLYRSVLLHAADYPIQDAQRQGMRLYGQRVPERPEARPVAQWCGQQGPRLLRQDIENGLNAIAAQIVRDLH